MLGHCTPVRTQISTGVIAGAHACCEASLQGSSEQQGSYFAQTSAAVHRCCIAAHLYEMQISVGVIAVAHACCDASLQGSSEQQGTYFAQTSAAVHRCCIAAHLYEMQISVGVTAVAHACCEASLQRSTEQQGSYFAQTSAAVHWCCITAHLEEEPCKLASQHACATAITPMGICHSYRCASAADEQIDIIQGAEEEGLPPSYGFHMEQMNALDLTLLYVRQYVKPERPDVAVGMLPARGQVYNHQPHLQNKAALQARLSRLHKLTWTVVLHQVCS